MHSKAILLSLHPEWWPRITSCQKTIEVRKSFPRDIELPARVIVYLTAPVKMIVGEFVCTSIVETTSVFKLSKQAMLEPWKLDLYANGAPLYGWGINNVIEYNDPLPLSQLNISRPPQSWMYIEADEVWPRRHVF